MPDSSLATSAWSNLQSVSNKWFHNPDLLALRACLATAKALDINTKPVWLMVIGPSSCGKSEFYIPCASAYTPHAISDEVSLGGLLSGSSDNKGEGILKKLTPKGLWIFSDFTVFLNLPEERRNSVVGAHRRIYDGEYSRSLSDGPPAWTGRIHVIAACTPGIERFHRAMADLGERMIQVRVEKQPSSDALLEKMVLQNSNSTKFHLEVTEAAFKVLLPNTPATIELTFEYQRLMLDWAEFVAKCRRSVSRNYKDEIVSVGHEEGTGRVFQQFLGLAMGDAANLGQVSVNGTQIPLIRRIAYDCLPWARRAVMLAMPTEERIGKHDLREISGITHNYTFDQAIQELLAIGIVDVTNKGFAGDFYGLTTPVQTLLKNVDSKDVQQTPPQTRE